MQQPDTQPGPYYVSVRRDDGDFRLLSGPYEKHSDALSLVDRAKDIAQSLDCKAVWYSYGTVRIRDDYAAPGILNKIGYDCATLTKTTTI